MKAHLHGSIIGFVFVSASNHSTRIELTLRGRFAISTNMANISRTRASTFEPDQVFRSPFSPLLSFSRKTGVVRTSFHSSTLRITISTDYFNRGRLDEEVSSKVIQRKATSKIVGGKNEILPIVRASFSISLDAAALLSRR